MNKNALCCLFCLALIAICSGQNNPPSDYNLYFASPAKDFMEAFPLGNGRLGAMVYGGVNSENISLNHSQLWRRKYENTTRPVSSHLSPLRALAAQNKWKEAEEMLREKLQPFFRTHGEDWKQGGAVNPYQPAGDLVITQNLSGNYTNYSRTLNMQTGVASISFKHGGTHYQREHFFSEDPSVFVVHLYSNRKSTLNLSLTMRRGDSTVQMKSVATSAGGNMVAGKGIDPECVQQISAAGNTVTFEGRFIEGVMWGMKARVMQKGGKLVAGKSKINVVQADEVWILVSIATDTESAQPLQRCEADLARAQKQISSLKNSATKVHSGYFNRVKLQLGSKQKKGKEDMYQWLQSIRSAPDASAYEKLFNYGRYLLICSSRKGNLPANLQGIWNEDYKPAWDSDFHYDINQQMNYWLADVTGLPECSEPFFRFNTSILPVARNNAKNIYGCRGILLPIATDPYSAGSIFRGPWLAWTGGAAWVAQHYWHHWEYTQDTAFLKEQAYPFLKEVAAFYQDFIYHDSSGKMILFPAMSPENSSIRPDGSTGFLCANPSGDFALVREVFTNLLAASKVLGEDIGKHSDWQKMLDNLPAYPISDDGALLEFEEPFKSTHAEHRHLSHLYGLFPGEEIDVFKSAPALVTAARKALEQRGVNSTGWATVHRACCWARLGDGEKALACLDNFARKQITPNLLGLHDPWDGINPSPRPFQIECNLGIVRAIAEMLMQSTGGEIRILPALPREWKSGRVQGLHAKGGFQVDIVWDNRSLKESRIRSSLNKKCIVRVASPAVLSIASERNSKKLYSKDGLLEFNALKGKEYIITPIQ